MDVKSFSKGGYQALFKCNNCSVEWEAHSTKSRCLVCNGRGRNLPIKRIDITEPLKKVSINLPQSENNNDLKVKKFKCDECKNEFFDVPNKESINRPGSKKKLCKTCYDKSIKRAQIKKYKITFKCNKCSAEWEALNTDSQCLECDGKGAPKRLKKRKRSKKKSERKPLKPNADSVGFKCNKCSTIWLAFKTESQCLKCDGKGNNIPKKKVKIQSVMQNESKIVPEKDGNKNKLKPYTVPFKCNKCSTIWKALNTESQCLKCDGKGFNIPKKDFVETKNASSFMVPFKCNKCSTIWKALNTESQCLKCDGKGFNIPKKDFVETKNVSSFMVPFKCNKCSTIWEALNTESKCLRLDCNGRGQNIPRKVENLRQFSCEKCYNARKKGWNKWRDALRVKCEECQEILYPIPYEEEFGICKFNCSNCTRKFIGFGSMSEKLDLRSKCYRCHKMVKPYEVIPNRDDINRKTRNTHSCSGCNGRRNCKFNRKALAFSFVKNEIKN